MQELTSFQWQLSPVVAQNKHRGNSCCLHLYGTALSTHYQGEMNSTWIILHNFKLTVETRAQRNTCISPLNDIYAKASCWYTQQQPPRPDKAFCRDLGTLAGFEHLTEWSIWRTWDSQARTSWVQPLDCLLGNLKLYVNQSMGGCKCQFVGTSITEYITQRGISANTTAFPISCNSCVTN